MRTIIDSSSPASVNRYLKLFEMANEALAEKGLTPVDPSTGEPLVITTIEQYFTCIKDLWDMGRKEFVYLLPLDETFFEIDVNTRTISIPREFAKGVGVQSDVIAETLLFKIPRYVDAKDLNDVDNIWVQWEFSHGNTIVDEGYSKVEWRYINYDPNYLIFAWPLTGRVTKNYGNLKFSIRFEGKKSEGSLIYYSLNTLSASVIINPALKADMNYSEEYDSADNLFENAIQNSQETSRPAETEISIPTFRAVDGGKPLVETAYLANGALDLTASAIVKDSGNLSYVWYLAEDADQNSVVTGTAYIETVDYSRLDYKRYYSKIENGESLAYTLYDGTIVNGKDTDGNAVYEMVARLTVDATTSGQIVGEYALDAINRQGWSSAAASKNNELQKVVIPGPQPVEIETDLAETGTLVSVVDETEYVDLAVVLKVEDLTGIKNAAGVQVDNPVVDYKWEKSIDKLNWYPVPAKSETEQNAVYTTAAELDAYLTETGYEDIDAAIADLPGWYKLTVTSTLNRKTTDPISTKISKVTRMPIEPVLKPVEDVSENLTAGSAINLEVSVENMEALSGELASEKLTYQWYTTDGEIIEGESGIVDASGKITYATTFAGASTGYQCKVINELNGKTAEKFSGAFIFY